MSAWKVVGMTRSWEGDPSQPAKDQYDGPDDGMIPGSERPDEIIYRLGLEKSGTVYDDGLEWETGVPLDTATATITVRYADGEDGVTAWVPFMAWADGTPIIHGGTKDTILDHLRNHQPPLLWEKEQ